MSMEHVSGEDSHAPEMNETPADETGELWAPEAGPVINEETQWNTEPPFWEVAREPESEAADPIETTSPRRTLIHRGGNTPLWIATAASVALVCAGLFFLRPASKPAETPAPVVVAQNVPQEPTPKHKSVTTRHTKRAASTSHAPKPVAAKPKSKKSAPVTLAKAPAPVRSAPRPAPPVVRADNTALVKAIPTEPIVPRMVPVSTSNAALQGPAVPNRKPIMRDARGAALRAQREAQSVEADRNAPDDYRTATLALEEGDTWNDAGWTDEAEQQFRKAERYYRSAIQQSVEPLGISRREVQATATAPRTLPPAHSLEFNRVLPEQRTAVPSPSREAMLP